MKKKKKKFAKGIIFIIVLIMVWVINTFTIKKTRVEISDNKIKNEITIAQISDLHGASFGANNDNLISKIKSEKPDIVVVTGDMYTHYGNDEQNKEGEKTAINLMASLAKEFEVYFVNGEHDNSSAYKKILKEKGIHVLDYNCEHIKIKNTRINLYGINNVYYSPTFDLKNEFQIDKSVYNILLAHICNAEAFTNFGIDLSICGDTHGGQVRLPYLGAVYDGENFFPEIVKNGDGKLMKGIYEQSGKKIFISSGLGNYPMPIRLFNRPEVAVIKLKPTP